MKAALYCRLSEEDRDKAVMTDDSGSIRNQKAMLTRYAEEQGWEIYDIYSDDDYAGSDRRRPAFNRLLTDAEAGRFDLVLCKTQSRFTRELELVEKYIHGLFPQWGIRFVSIVDNADTDNRGNKKSRQINGLVNEWYLEDMSENIRSVLTSRRMSGLHIGAFALYGYEKDPERKGHLIVDEEAAGVVREVFRLFASGCGKTAIARILNGRGIPNPTEYKRRKGLRFKGADGGGGGLWRYAAVSAMLTNEMYIGNMVQGKYASASYKTKINRPVPKEDWLRVEGTHEPIIERELWDRVQEMIRERSKPFAGGRIGLFAGKVRCGSCHASLRSSRHAAVKKDGTPDGKRYLQCETRFVARDACPGAFIGTERLERVVLEELRRLSGLYLDPELLMRHVRIGEGRQEKLEALRRDLAALERKAGEYARGLRELYLDKTRGIVTEGEYLELAEDFRREKAGTEETAAGMKARIEALEKAEEGGEDSFIKYLLPGSLSREAVDGLIDCIYVFPRIPGTRNVPVEIRWRF